MSQPLPPPVPKKRSAVWVFVFVGALALVFSVFLTWRIVLHRRVASRIAAVRVEKLPTSGAEVANWVPPVSDADNGAIPIAQAFAMLTNFPDGRSNSIVVTNLVRTNVWSAETTKLVADFLQMNRPAFDKLREGLRREQFRYAVDYAEGYAALLPHLAKFRQVAGIMSLEARLAVETGRTNDWPRIVEEQIALAETLNSEPLLISQLIRTACLRMACDVTQRLLPRSPPSAQDCRKLSQLFWRAAGTNLIPNALIAERAMTLPVFRASIGQIDRMGDQDAISERELLKNKFAFFEMAGFFDKDKAFYMDVMEQAIRTAKLGPPGSLALTNEFQAAVETAKEKHYIMSGMFLPALGKAAIKFASGEAEMRIAATALAIEEFRQTNALIPENLQALAPNFLPEIPEDPFDGKPLRYIREENGFCLYSVGPDGIDDHGRAAPDRKKLNDTTTSDLAWTVKYPR